MVAQVGGEERVHSGRADRVEQAVAGAAADGDAADGRVEVARDADALRGGGQPPGRPCGGVAQRLGDVQLADPAEAVLRYEGADDPQVEGARERVGDAGVGGVGVGVRDVQGDVVLDQAVHDAALERGGRDGGRAPQVEGWWVTTSWAPSATASSATSWTGSTANRTRVTSASGSPHTVPTASHCSARSGARGRRARRGLQTDGARDKATWEGARPTRPPPQGAGPALPPPAARAADPPPPRRTDRLHAAAARLPHRARTAGVPTRRPDAAAPPSGTRRAPPRRGARCAARPPAGGYGRGAVTTPAPRPCRGVR